MKNYRNIFLLIPILIFINEGCISQNNKLLSQENLRIADSILIKNINHSDSLSEGVKLDFLNALSYLDIAIELDSMNIGAYESKISVLRELKRYKDVIPTLKKQLSLDPSNAEGYVMLGEYYNTNNEVDSSVIAFTRAKKNFLARPPSDLRNANLIYVEYMITKDKVKALGLLKEFPIQDSSLLTEIKSEIYRLHRKN